MTPLLVNVMGEIKERLLSLQTIPVKTDDDPMVYRMSVASEYPVGNWGGEEILVHRPESINLERLPGMVVLWEHGQDISVGSEPLGKVLDWGIEGTKSVVTFRWAETDLATKYKTLVDSGIVTNVSIRYQLDEWVERDGKCYVTRFTPVHCSFVSDPADPSVGVGRSLEVPMPAESEKETEVNITINIGTQESEEEEECEEGEEVTTVPMEVSDMACKPLYKSMIVKNENPGGTMGTEIDMNELRSQERERQSSIRAMADKWSRELGPRFGELGETLINSDKTVEEARSAFYAEMERGLGKQTPLSGFSNPTGQPSDYLPGYGKREDQRYSLLRLLRSMTPAFPDDYGKNCFEREISQQIAQQIGGDPNTIRIPTRNLGIYGQRDIQQVGSATLGGNLVGTDYRPDMWVEALRNIAVVFQLGAKFITGLKGNVSFPKETGVSTADWINENDPAPESNYTVGQLSLTPKTIAAYTTLTRTLMLQATPDAEMIARDNLLKAIALKIDATALYGSGIAPVPKGIVNYSGIKSLTTALGSDGGYPTYAALVELFGAIESSNANINGLKWLINSKTMARLMVTPVQTSGVEGNFIIKDGATSMVGLPFAVSNQCRSTLTKGNGTGLSELYLGDWSQLYVGEWEGVSLNVNYNGKTFQTGGAEVVAFQTLDMNVAHEESFAAITEVKTA